MLLVVYSFHHQKKLHATIFQMASRLGIYLSRFLRRMKACIDEFQPNTNQANYFEVFWRITSKTNTKMEIRNSKNL